MSKGGGGGGGAAGLLYRPPGVWGNLNAFNF